MASITCQDCGASRHQVPNNTRYCKSCRLLRDVAYWRHPRRDCKSCRQEFAPLGRNDYYCSGCDPGLYHLAAPCRLARPDEAHEGPPTMTGIPVCAACMRSPTMRKRLISSLILGQRARRKTNDWSLE